MSEEKWKDFDRGKVVKELTPLQRDVAKSFREREIAAKSDLSTAGHKVETAILAGGCFWGVEDLLR